MVRLSHRIAIVLLLLAPWWTTLRAAQLHISADRQQLELGQPIWLTVSTDQTALSLKNLDLGPWRNRVALPREFDVEQAADNHSQHARLHVYPLRTGKLRLPPLSFLNTYSNALHLEVLPARDPVSGQAMDFHCRAPVHTAWQTQELVLSCQLQLSDGYAVFRQSPVNTTDLQILPMPKQQTVSPGSKTHTRYQLGWLFIPARDGEQTISLPPIDYVRDGVVARRFYLAPFRLKVRRLPAWLPGTIPVGKVTLIRYRPEHFWLDSGVLSQLHLALQTDGVAEDMLPDYARQLRSNHAWRFYPAQMQSPSAAAGQAVIRQLHYRIPLQARAIGIRRLPDLRLQYFDPDIGSLRTLQIRGPLLVVINGWIKLLLAMSILALLIYFGNGVWQAWRRYWYRYRAYRRALQQLRLCDNLPGLRRVMQGMARAEGWQANLSYRQWQARMRQVSPLAAQVAVEELDAASYAGAEIDAQALNRALAGICRRRRLGLS